MVCFRQRQIDVDAGSFTGFALHVNVAVVLFDDAVYRRQSQTAALAFRFGGKEEIENPLDGLLVHSRSSI